MIVIITTIMTIIIAIIVTNFMTTFMTTFMAISLMTISLMIISLMTIMITNIITNIITNFITNIITNISTIICVIIGCFFSGKLVTNCTLPNCLKILLRRTPLKDPDPKYLNLPPTPHRHVEIIRNPKFAPLLCETVPQLLC